MEDNKKEVTTLPKWNKCAKKVNAHEPVSPLEAFIYNNEPAGAKSKQFRKELSDLINYIQYFYE